MFSRILIAIRGEVALRIIRACKELGVESVAVFSEADRDASYQHLADEAICIGKGPSADSYLNIPRIIAAAEIADVEAIHPGYGFLAENAHFAEVCRDCKIEFIGPSVKAMRMLGDKIQAAIDELPEDLKAAVVLRDVQGLSNEEAADVLEVSISALKARLHRGRVALRETLSDYLAQLESAE